jgi:hypothetical protein
LRIRIRGVVKKPSLWLVGADGKKNFPIPHQNGCGLAADDPSVAHLSPLYGNRGVPRRALNLTQPPQPQLRERNAHCGSACWTAPGQGECPPRRFGIGGIPARPAQAAIDDAGAGGGIGMEGRTGSRVGSGDLASICYGGGAGNTGDIVRRIGPGRWMSALPPCRFRQPSVAVEPWWWIRWC